MLKLQTCSSCSRGCCCCNCYLRCCSRGVYFGGTSAAVPTRARCKPPLLLSRRIAGVGRRRTASSAAASAVPPTDCNCRKIPCAQRVRAYARRSFDADRAGRRERAQTVYVCVCAYVCIHCMIGTVRLKLDPNLECATNLSCYSRTRRVEVRTCCSSFAAAAAIAAAAPVAAPAAAAAFVAAAPALFLLC